MEQNFLLKRLVDCVRLEIEAGSIKKDSPVGIAYRDYATLKNSERVGTDAGHGAEQPQQLKESMLELADTLDLVTSIDDPIKFVRGIAFGIRARASV